MGFSEAAKAAAKTAATIGSSSLQKQHHKQQQTVKSGSKINTNSKKNSTQQEKLSIMLQKNGKNSIKNNKSSKNILEGQKRQGCVLSHNNSCQGGRECGSEANPEQLKPRGVALRRVVAGRCEGQMGVSSRGNSVGIPAHFVSIDCNKL